MELVETIKWLEGKLTDVYREKKILESTIKHLKEVAERQGELDESFEGQYDEDWDK